MDDSWVKDCYIISIITIFINILIMTVTYITINNINCFSVASKAVCHNCAEKCCVISC